MGNGLKMGNSEQCSCNALHISYTTSQITLFIYKSVRMNKSY